MEMGTKRRLETDRSTLARDKKRSQISRRGHPAIRVLQRNPARHDAGRPEISRLVDSVLAHKGGDLMGEKIELSYLDLCRLSQAFDRDANLAEPGDYRINEWLKQEIARRTIKVERV